MVYRSIIIITTLVTKPKECFFHYFKWKKNLCSQHPHNGIFNWARKRETKKQKTQWKWKKQPKKKKKKKKDPELFFFSQNNEVVWRGQQQQSFNLYVVVCVFDGFLNGDKTKKNRLMCTTPHTIIIIIVIVIRRNTS